MDQAMKSFRLPPSLILENDKPYPTLNPLPQIQESTPNEITTQIEQSQLPSKKNNPCPFFLIDLNPKKHAKTLRSPSFLRPPSSILRYMLDSHFQSGMFRAAHSPLAVRFCKFENRTVLFWRAVQATCLSESFREKDLWKAIGIGPSDWGCHFG